MPVTHKPSLVNDSYAEVAQVYDQAIGSLEQRSDQYKQFFANVLQQHGCTYVLDASCGTGVDSAILLDHGFKLVSTDASAQMLAFAKKMKANRAGDPRYDDWIIEQAFWETLPEDLDKFLPPGTQFDAVVCLANSISHIMDDDGEQTMQKQCLRNLAKVVKPGGVLLLDHRNYDAMLNDIQLSTHNVYYKYSNPIEINTSLVMENDKPKMVAINFYVDIDAEGKPKKKSKFQLYCYPHRLESFTRLLRQACSGASHSVLGDFQPLGAVPVPGFYQHIVVKDT